MNWLDYVMIAITGVSVVAAIIRGFSRSMVPFVALLLGVIFALWFYGIGASFIAPYVSHRGFANILGFLFVLTAFIVIGALLGFLLEKIFKWSGLSVLDRLLGAIFGLLRGAVVCMAIVLALSAFSPKSPPDAVVHSRFAPYLMSAADVVVAAAPREVRDGFRSAYQKAREIWRETMRKAAKQLPAEEM